MAEDAHRPDPDALLQRVTAEAQRASRARLKVFFGFAPGVGKTYAMLEAARRLRAQGVDVIVGCAETHGRSETAALLQGLEVLPKRRVEHRGTVLEEFDLERALARRPQVLLLDELAHTNAPGLQHAKRHQDVLDLLHAGIDVHTTLNVQHVESLNDVVAQVTGVRVRETVPDALLDRADELELVDLPPDELLQRLAQGKVYLGERAEQAARNFFQRGNLLALRELALRRTAERVDADVRAHRAAHAIDKTWSAAERILVCVGPAPQSAKVLRAGRRMAAGLRAPWSAVVVEPIGVPLGAADRERLDGHLRLAESLGAQVVRLSGARPSEVLLEYARKHDVTRLMLGKPTHARLIDRLRGSFLDQIVRGSGDIDVQVVSGDASEPPRDDPRGPLEMTSPLRGYVWSAVLVTLATALAALLRSLLALPDLVMVYLIVIMATALRFGRGPSLLAAALSVGAYDFFFVPPFFTFAVTDARHTLTFAMMFAVGALLSSLMLRIQRQEQDARAREARTASLYALSRELGGAHDEQAAAQILARHAAEVFGGGVAVLLAKPGGALEERARVGDFPSESSELGVARWVFEFGRPAGLGTETLPGARVICVPLRAGPDVIGILALAPKQSRRLTLAERDFLETFVRQGVLTITRARSAEEARVAALKARQEELRSSLLSSVSHDLRTPLAAITGAATTLRDHAAVLPEREREELLESISEEAERLERLVGNLLDMTRLESGNVKLRRDWVPLEEPIGSALGRLEARLVDREVAIALPDDLPLVAIDPLLFEQVLVNLLENALKYTPARSPLELRAAQVDGGVQLEVADRGPGLPAGDEERMFERFVRGRHGAGAGGAGLGLAICRGIIAAHGGTIRAENRPGGGATFRIFLPQTDTPPELSAGSAASAAAPSATGTAS